MAHIYIKRAETVEHECCDGGAFEVLDKQGQLRTVAPTSVAGTERVGRPGGAEWDCEPGGVVRALLGRAASRPTWSHSA
jgi:hypothetical protein